MGTLSGKPDSRLGHIRFKPVSARHLRPPAVEPSHDDPVWSALLGRIYAEFNEMPGLSLTLAQACRLFNVPESRCSRLLQHMVDGGLLRRRKDGRYTLKVEAA